MDKAKRQTLKQMSAVALATSTGLIATQSAFAHSARGTHSRTGSDQALDGATTPSVSSITVRTRVSSRTNDLEVVISNAGEESARITQITPSQTSTARGRFVFAPLLEQGPLELAPGQSVAVVMTPHSKAALKGDVRTMQARSLTQALRSSFSVVTDDEAFAVVDVVEGLRFG